MGWGRLALIVMELMAMLARDMPESSRKVQ